MECHHVRLGLVAGSDSLESDQAVKTLLRLLVLCAFFASAGANAAISSGGHTTDTLAHFCSSLSNPSYWYSFYAYSAPGIITCHVYNAAGYQGVNSFSYSGTDTPGECGAGSTKVLNVNYKCVDPVVCTYPQVRDVTTNTCKPELVCPAGKTLKVIGINPNWSGCYPDTPPVPDGTLGNPPKPDGRCAPGLVNQGGVCVYNSGGTGGTGPGGSGKGGPGQPPLPDPLTGENNCTPPNVIFAATGLCQPPPASCTSPNVVNPYTGACVPPLGPDEHFDPDTGDPVSGGGDPPPAGDCVSPRTLDVPTGLCMDPVCVVPQVNNSVTGACEDPHHACNTGQIKNFWYLDTIAKITPRGPEPALLVGAPITICGNQVLCFGYGCGYPFEDLCEFELVKTNYGNSAGYYGIPAGSSGAVGDVMSIDGEFRNTGRYCSIPTPTVIADVPGSLPPDVSLPPVGCPPGTHNNNASPAVCVADGLTCPVGQHVVQFGISETGGVMETCVSDTSDTGTDGVPPSPDGTCAAGLVNVNGICTNLIGMGGTPGVPGGTQGTASQSGQCGAPGFPPCSTDIGRLFGTTGTGTDPTARTSGEVGSALGVGNFPVLNSIKGWKLPAHSSSCEFGSFTFNEKSYSFQPVCDQFTTYKPQMSIAFLFLWSVLPFFMVLRS